MHIDDWWLALTKQRGRLMTARGVPGVQGEPAAAADVLLAWYCMGRQRCLRGVKLAPGANASHANHAPSAASAPLLSWLNRCKHVLSNSSLFGPAEKVLQQGPAQTQCDASKAVGELRAAAAASPRFLKEQQETSLSMKGLAFWQVSTMTSLWTFCWKIIFQKCGTKTEKNYSTQVVNTSSHSIKTSLADHLTLSCYFYISQNSFIIELSWNKVTLKKNRLKRKSGRCVWTWKKDKKGTD